MDMSHNIQDDNILNVKYLVEKYGNESIIDFLNEYNYGRTRVSFDTTGGSDLKGIKGLPKALPGLAVSTVLCWPFVLLNAIGILHERGLQHWEDRNGWTQAVFNPNYWTEYFANVNKHKDKDSIFKNKDRDTENELDSLGLYYDETDKKIKHKDSKKEVTEEELESLAKEKAFIFFWITFSNGEIVRVRAENEVNAKKYADIIIKYTEDIYNDFCKRKDDQGQKVFDIVFNDGERATWVAQNAKTAGQEALKSRKDLSELMHKNIDKNDDIQIESIRLKRSVYIECPKMGIYTISKKQPGKYKSDSKIPKQIYNYNMLTQYTISFPGYTVNFPSGSDAVAKSFVTKLFSEHSPFKAIVKKAEENKRVKYEVKYADGDKYILNEISSHDAANQANIIRKTKERILEYIMSDSQLEAYNEIKNLYPSYSQMMSYPAEVFNPDEIKIPKTVTLYKYESTDGSIFKRVPVVTINL